MGLLSCGGRLWASRCIVFQLVVPWFFYVFPPDFSLVYAYEGEDLFVCSSMLGCCGVFLLVQFLCVI